eukprot:TRINITY_DN15520_c0_g1_i1.p1 TRINITY_DN15520_c0_g1~~TRINITY_DN15520_c0_g1_i1.p1  ORF type:complete len:182 (+),score=45.04 TRINITY_DN15520_c0_g1_i1:84-548(+)
MLNGCGVGSSRKRKRRNNNAPVPPSTTSSCSSSSTSSTTSPSECGGVSLDDGLARIFDGMPLELATQIIDNGIQRYIPAMNEAVNAELREEIVRAVLAVVKHAGRMQGKKLFKPAVAQELGVHLKSKTNRAVDAIYTEWKSKRGQRAMTKELED